MTLKFPKLLFIFILFTTFFTVFSSVGWAKEKSPGVNKFVWEASLKTINFMPLFSADPFSGVIITDWYSLPNSSATRYKLDIYVLNGILNANSVTVKVFKQTKSSNIWTDVAVSSEVATRLEDTILNLARQLRNSSN